MPRPFRLPSWARWVAAWMAAVFFLVAGGSVTLLMSQSSGCTTSMFQISGATSFTALAQNFTLSWSKTPSSLTCASEAAVQGGVTWLSPQTSTASGSNGSATYTIQANTGSQRTATILVGSTALAVGSTSFQDGTTFTLTQSGSNPLPTITGAVVSNSTGSCFILPSARSSFRATDAIVWFDFSYDGGYTGDNWSIEWFEPNGSLYVTDTFTQAGTGGSWCWEYDIGVAGNEAAAFPGLWTVKAVDNGQVLITKQFTITPASPATIVYYSMGSQIWSLNLASKQTTLIDNSAGGSIYGLLFDSQGRIIYTTGIPFWVRIYDPATMNDSLLASGFTSGAGDIALDPSGTSVLISYPVNNAIYRISLSGGAATLLNSFPYPNGLAYDSQDNLYVVINSSQVEQIDPNTGAAIRTGSAVSGKGGLYNVAYDSFSNKLWAGDIVNNCIRSLDLATLTPSSCVGTGIILEPTGITSDGVGNIFVSADETPAVMKYNIATGAITQVSSTLSSILWLAPLSGLGAPPAAAPPVVGSLTLISGGGQTASPGQPFSQPVAFQVADTNHNPVAGVTVNFSVTGGASLSASSATSNAQGQVSVNVTAGNTAGPVTITASYNTLTASASLTVASTSGCSVTLSPTSIDLSDVGSSTGLQFSVTAPSGCSWTATSNASFLTVANGSGAGSGTVTYGEAGTGSAATGTISVKTSTATANFTVNLVAGNAALFSASPPSSCGPAVPNNYFLQNSSLTLYPWATYTPFNSSDVVTAQVFQFVSGNGATAIGTPTKLQAATGCFFAPITLSAPNPGLYEVVLVLNGTFLSPSPQFTIVANQITLSPSGTLTALPGPNQESVQAMLPIALPNAATVALNATFSTAAGVVNAAASPGQYDCRFVPQSGASVSVTVPPLQRSLLQRLFREARSRALAISGSPTFR